MPSTYSSNLKIELMATGENSNTWGTITNTNLGTSLEQAIVGKADITMSSTTVTLTYTNTNAAQNARAVYLNLSGSPGGAADLVVPAIQKPYIVKNGSDQQVTVKVSGQTGVIVPVGKTVLVYNNGTDVVTSVDHIPSLTLASALPVASGGTGITAFGTGVATALGQNVSGSGSIALTTSPVFTTPNLGTPSAATLTSATGLPIDGGTTGTLPVARGGTGITAFGTGVATALGVNTGSAGAFVVNGGALGTPSSGTLTSATGLPIDGGTTGTLPVSRGGTGVTTSTGTGAVVRAITPTISTSLAVNGDTSLDGAVVVNEAGADKDFRVEGDTDPNLLFVDASTDRVGIGTSSPATKLHLLTPSAVNVELRISNNQSYASVIENAVGEMQLYTPGTAMTFFTNGNEHMRITAAGNVGIGTSSPNALATLHVSGSSGITTQILESTGSVAARLNLRTTSDSNGSINYDTGNWIFFNNSGGLAAERMRITAAGNVGIGTNSPTNLFVVSNGGAAGVEVNPSTGNIFTFNRSTSLYTDMTLSSNAIVFQTNGTTDSGRFTAAGTFQFNSGYGSVATAFGCRAWVNFNGTAVVSPASMTGVRASGNVSSVLDNGTGDYTINFTTAMPDTNYAVVGAAKEYNATSFTTVVFYLGKNQTYANTYSTSSVRVNAASPDSGTNTDAFAMNVAIFR